jgi:prepilin-type processing-associated H-X9-DG protein
MKSKIAFMKRDLVVALVCLVFLLMSFGFIGKSGRERAKRAVCLNNLKKLTLAWNQYADDNGDRIVNGAPIEGRPGYADYPGCGCPGLECPGFWDCTNHVGEKPWVGVAWSYDYYSGEPLDPDIQLSAIQKGALFPYTKNEKLYRCPAGYSDEMLNYAVMDGMNGFPRSQTKEPGVWIKKRSEIHTPPPAYRMVFIDEGWITPDSYGVWYTHELWWDDPPSRHGDGTTLSFADGHCEYYKWKGLWTIEYARSTDGSHPRNDVKPGDPIWLPNGEEIYVPADYRDFEDLYYIQKGCWGGIKYTPTY